MTDTQHTEKATFAAGCFWGVEAEFRQIPGVIATTVGYTGGRSDHPSYEQVCSHTTGHAEAVLVEYDPAQVTYDQLLDAFWQLHDPAQPAGSRRRRPVPLGDLLPLARAGDRGEGVEESRSGSVQAADRHRDHGRARVLVGRGLPPALPREARDGELRDHRQQLTRSQPKREPAPP